MIDTIQARARSLSLATIIVGAFAIIPYVLGWVVGMLIRGVFFIVAAFIEGYRAGRGS